MAKNAIEGAEIVLGEDDMSPMDDEIEADDSDSVHLFNKYQAPNHCFLLILLSALSRFAGLNVS